MRWLIAALVLVSFAGCVSGEETEPELSDADGDVQEDPGSPLVGYAWNTTQSLDNSGLWISYRYDSPQSTSRGQVSVHISCGKEVMLLLPSTMEVDDGATHFVFEPSMVFTSGTYSSWHAASSSQASFVGEVMAVVASGPVCIELDVEFHDPPGQLEVLPFNATWSQQGPSFGPLHTFSHEIVYEGWTHVHRRPLCTTPLQDMVTEQVTSEVSFPNGQTLRAGPYLNGLIPGPTIDDAAFFGVFHDVAGSLTAEIASGLEECITIIDTDLSVPWIEASGSYVDRWWRQEPLLV